jgi:hypothetical protein
MYQEGKPKRMALRKGDLVRVPNERGAGSVKAEVITPAEPERKVRNIWVRYCEGPDAGDTARVDVSYVQPA